jgi:diacylglycerol kinase family enzyme
MNLLPYSVGLPLSPTSAFDDGKAEIIFDTGDGKAILTSFIRKINKGKYVYSDEIRMFRGSKITVSSVRGRKLYIDGEIIKYPEANLSVETFQNKIRVFQKKSA